MSRTLYKNSLIFFIGSIVSGFGGYLYQLFMGRMLSLKDFGTLESLINFFALASVPAGALAVVSTQIVATLKAQNKNGAIRFFIHRLTQLLFLSGVVVFLGFLVLSPFAARFLKLDSKVSYVIYGSSIVFAFLSSVRRGALSGLQRFKDLSINTILESGLRFVIALIFVSLAFGVNGAVGATVLAALVAYFYISWQLKDLKKYQSEPFGLRPHFKNFLMVLIYSLAITALLSLDIILVKRFFTAEETGLYSGISLLAKIIFFASAAISGVLFPMSTELYESGDHAAHRKLVWKALGLMSLITSAGIIVYWLAPHLVIKILFGSRYLVFAPYLVFLAVAAGFFSIVQLLATYFLSIQKRWFIAVLVLASIAEIMLIYEFHQSIKEVALIIDGVLFVTGVILFAGFVIKNGHSKLKIRNLWR